MARAIATPGQLAKAKIARGLSIAAFAKTRTVWFDDLVRRGLMTTMRQRLNFVGNYMVDKVKLNLSVPVVRRPSKARRRNAQGKIVRKRNLVTVERSKPGEFPRIEFGLLRRGIFQQIVDIGGATGAGLEVQIATDRQYGLYLEVSSRLDRSFLVRTLNEELSTLQDIMLRPVDIKGGPET